MGEITHIEVEAEVRYWDDAHVNGMVEDEKSPTIYGADGVLWQVRIEIAQGRVDGWPQGMTASVHYKVCDAGRYWLTDIAGERVFKWAGHYVPNAYLCHGDDGFGDYIIMHIDGGGQIANYKRPVFDPQRWYPCR